MTRQAPVKALDLLERALRKQQTATRGKKFSYRIPSLWVSPKGVGKETTVNPYTYFLSAVSKVKQVRVPRRGKPSGGEWTRSAVIYNMFVRTTAAYDHDGDGQLDLPLNGDGFRETGTFLKALAMLPYIKQLGANTIHLLPVTSIGHDGNKGTLGSPYAIKNAYELDENLGEPSLGLDVKTQFKAFVEAAHRMGFKVVAEFVFRTAAKDGDWVKEHPEWFYWIKESVPLRASGSTDEAAYGSPIFTPEELRRIHADVTEGRLGDLIPPHESYKAFFTEPPASGMVTYTGGRYLGTTGDGVKVKIPGAFADWPPDDNQPPWGDVTYLRMYDHPDFNYIGYNTIRMYDARLATKEHVNTPLWKKIIGIIPYYQKEFRIDGVMIDMGHALPMDLKSRMVAAAREHDHDFAFWDENFSVTQRSREEGYNAVFGFTMFDQHHPDRMKSLCSRHATEGFPIPYFATPENHNTPRAAARPGGVVYARWTVAVNAFLPAIPFIHSGFELAERYPINTGLDFTTEEIRRFPSEKLPLFSEHAYDWLSHHAFPEWVGKVMAVRQRYANLVADPSPATFQLLHDSNPKILAFARLDAPGKRRVAVVSNMNHSSGEMTSVPVETQRARLVDLLTGSEIHRRDGHLHLHLEPGQALVFEF
jgi:hypothetical protein